MRTLDEEVAYQWKQLGTQLSLGFDPRRVFEVGFALGAYYTVERMKPNGSVDKKSVADDQDTAR